MPTILITGANRGIGLGLAKAYAADGWQVIACCRNPAEAAELRAVPKVEIHALEVTSAESIAALKRALNNRPIDVLLNNAGTHGDRVNFGQTDPELWLKIFAVNTIAPIQIMAALIDNVAASDQKKVVSVSSRVGSIGLGPTGGNYGYRSSKTALNMAMANAAHEVKARGVAVAVVHPGWVQTDMGGANATVTVDQSIAGLREVIAKVNLAETGRFYNYTGEELPW
jgi:NAD(P)-dependent dehydrogenase (short-subunit alcohol dehydrogenase family)